MKIYCQNCKHFKLVSGRNDKCNHPNNKKDSYKRPNSIYIDKPDFINTNNNCDWFEEKQRNKWWEGW